MAKLEKKVEDDLRAGVRLVWVMHPETQVAQVIHGDGTGYRLRAQDDLTGQDVILNFRGPVGEWFPKEAEAATESEPVPETRNP